MCSSGARYQAQEHPVAPLGMAGARMPSHVAVCRAALCALLGCGSAAFWRLDLRPASVSAFRADSGQYIVTLVNDVCHLHGIE